MAIEKRDAALAAGALLLLAVALVRMAVPDRSRLRPLSIQGLDIPTEPIAQGQQIERVASWSPPADVYVIGWTYELGSSAARGELNLQHGSTRLFVAKGGGAAPAQNPAFFGSGAAYRLGKGESLDLRYRVLNTGAAGETLGASALVYFVPVEGN